LAKKIKFVPTQYEPVIFDIVGFGMYFDLDYVYGYPQIHPMIEYYVGCKPILCFATPEGLATDLLYMINHSRHKFSPVVIVRDLRNIDRVLSILREKEALKPEARFAYKFVGAYVMNLTDYLQWGADETNKNV
jgi:hypothetical protein